MFYNHNKQCSIAVTVPRKLFNDYALINKLFRAKAYLLFADKADTVVKRYDHPSSRWKFTVLFKNSVEDTEYYDGLVSKLIKWTVMDVEAEYDKRVSRELGAQIASNFNNYKKLHSIC